MTDSQKISGEIAERIQTAAFEALSPWADAEGDDWRDAAADQVRDAVLDALGLEQVGWRTFTDDTEDDWWWMEPDEQLPVNHRSEPFYRLRAAEIGRIDAEPSRARPTSQE